MWKRFVDYYLRRISYEFAKKFGFLTWNLRKNNYWARDRNTRIDLLAILAMFLLLGLLTVFASEMLQIYQTSLYWQSWAFKMKVGLTVLLLGLFIGLAFFIRFTDHK